MALSLSRPLVPVQVGARIARRERDLRERERAVPVADLRLEHGSPAQDRLALARPAHDHVARGAAAVLRRVERVPVELAAVAARPQRLGEALARRVDVQEPRCLRAVVPERVDHTRGDEHVCSRRRYVQRLAVRPDAEHELALEHVPRVGVLLVDVRVRPLLARLPRESRVDSGEAACSHHGQPRSVLMVCAAMMIAVA